MILRNVWAETSTLSLRLLCLFRLSGGEDVQLRRERQQPSAQIPPPPLSEATHATVIREQASALFYPNCADF